MQGISYTTYYIETVRFIFIISYNLCNNREFIFWGEHFCIAVQDIIILILFGFYDKKLGSLEYFGSLILFVLISAPLLLLWVPVEIYNATLVITMIMFIISRFPQILLNYKNQNTGHLAIGTTFL